MYSVVETEEFSDWLAGLKDLTTQKRLQVRLRKATLGNLGDVKAVGDNVLEMGEFFWARLAHVLCRAIGCTSPHAGRWRQIKSGTRY